MIDDRLRRWVEGVLGAEIATARRKFGGGSRELWFVEVDRGTGVESFVVRQETGAGAFSGTSMSLEREAVVYRALEGTAVPVAGLVAASPDGDALVLEHVPGTARIDDLDPDAGDLLLADFMRAVAELHALDVDELDLPGFERPADAADHALADLARWREIATTRPTPSDPLVDYAFAWLERHAPTQVPRTVLVQGDTGPGNFLREGTAVTGLVDWEFAHLGDPMDDLAWIDMRAGRVGTFSDTARRDALYEEASGVTIDPDSIRYYSVMVQLRCAITTGVTIGRGGGAVGLGAYFAPHHRFVTHLGMALADAIGFEPSIVAPPVAGDTELTPVYDHAIAGLDEVLGGLDDASSRLRARAARLLLEHDRTADRFGDSLSVADAADLVDTLGTDPASEELCSIARTAGATGDTEVLDLLCRMAQRAQSLWDTPGVGGPTPPRPPARGRTARG